MNTDSSLIYAINVGNLVLGAVGFLLLFVRTTRRRREYPREVHLLFVILEAFVIALLVTSAELLVLPGRVKPPAQGQLLLISVVITVVKFGLIWVLWTTRNALYRTSDRHVEEVGAGFNADETDVNTNFVDHPKEGT